MVLRVRSLLKHDFASRIEDAHRDGTVQLAPIQMSANLLIHAESTVVDINKYDLLLCAPIHAPQFISPRSGLLRPNAAISLSVNSRLHLFETSNHRRVGKVISDL